MKYYDCFGNEKDYQLLDKVGNGCCGDVFFISPDELLKIYYPTCSDSNKLKKIVYDAIKEINSEHIMKINELLFDHKIEGLYFDINHLFKTNFIDAYTCSYIKPDDVDILSTDSQYLLYNLKELSKVFSSFAERSILAGDIKWSNVILQNDKIVLIDLDGFSDVNISFPTLDVLNQKLLLTLFKKLFINCIDKYEYDCHYISTVYSLFDDFSVNDYRDDFKNINEFFESEKYPIDAIKKYQKA